jgi:processive 1,2-diacylglycerol beta-glucosyltransferase
MILLGRTYGQEKANSRMLTSMGAAMQVTTTRELLGSLRHVAHQPQSLEAMLINAEILRYPYAALDIAKETFVQIETSTTEGNPRRKKHFLWFYWGKKPVHTR